MLLRNTFILVFTLLCSTMMYGTKKRIHELYPSNLTRAFKLAMNSSYDTLVVSKLESPWILGPMRFQGVMDKTILFEEGVEIIAKPKAFPQPTQAFFGFYNCTGINLIGQRTLIRMQKSEYKEGEWRHIFLIRGCIDVVVDSFILYDSGGDGIEISGNRKKGFSENVKILNCKSINNRRQGISISSGKNIEVFNSEFSDTKGTMPGAGVDLEPNKPDDILVGVRFVKCRFENNYNSGIKLALSRLNASSTPVDIEFNQCVLSKNFHESNPKVPAQITLLSSTEDGVKGHVIFDNCIVENYNNMIIYARKDGNAYHVKFKDFLTRQSSTPADMPLIYLEVPDYRRNSSAGSFNFESFYIEDSLSNDVLLVRGSRLGTLRELVDVNGTITVKRTEHRAISYVNYNPLFNKNVDLRIVSKN